MANHSPDRSKWNKNPSKIEVWRRFSGFLEPIRASWTSLGASWGRLGASWARLGASWEASWARLGASWGCLGGPLSVSRGLFGRLGASWGRLGLDFRRKRDIN